MLQATLVIEGFSGEVVVPSSKSYDETRHIWNAMHDRRPSVIALCESAADVAAAIRHARSHDLRIAIRGGGHSLPGFSTVDGGLVIDLRRLNAVTVDPATRIATVQGGALLGDLDRAAQEFGLVVPAGVISHTGAGGLTLGGGVGRLMRKYGLTVDSLISAEVVTAEGELVRTSATENPDLFWALRGGGGNFGVVTRFDYTCHEISDLAVLATFHRLDEAAAMLRRADAAMADPATPDDLLWTSFVRKAPPMPWVPADLVGEPGVMSLIEWSGDLAEGMALLDDLRQELAPTAWSLEEVPFLTMQTMGDEVFRHGLHSYVKATFADELSEGLIEVLLDRASSLGSPLAQVEVLSVGGAIARVARDATAYVHRDARWLINIPVSWVDPADTDTEIAWVRDTFAALQPHVSGGAYVNFMEADEVAADETAYGDTLARLVQVKTDYDPHNVFNLNQNIAPAVRA
jgi:FAD/FMN-containing dehydrogenase